MEGRLTRAHHRSRTSKASVPRGHARGPVRPLSKFSTHDTRPYLMLYKPQACGVQLLPPVKWFWGADTPRSLHHTTALANQGTSAASPVKPCPPLQPGRPCEDQTSCALLGTLMRSAAPAPCRQASSSGVRGQGSGSPAGSRTACCTLSAPAPAPAPALMLHPPRGSPEERSSAPQASLSKQRSCAAHLVGTSTRATGPSGWLSALWPSSWRRTAAGSRKASVFPLPGSAVTSTSRPARQCGQHLQPGAHLD